MSSRVLSPTLLLLLAGCRPAPAPDTPPDSPLHEWSPGDTHESTPRVDTQGETGPVDTGDPPPPAPPPILLVVLADDIGENALWAMDAVQARLLPESVHFTRAYSTVPLCCPVRSSFMSGGYYPAATGVQSNDLPNGGASLFVDTDTLATRLQNAGYTTALIGKYLNGYENGIAPYIPPGWDLFLGLTFIGDSTDSELIRGSSTPDAGSEGVAETTGGEHLTGWLFDEALAFLDAHPDEPIFLFLTPQSPHIYGSPAAEDVGTWAGYEQRPPSFAEADMTDKPAWVQAVPSVTPADINRWDAETQLMYENQESLDRAMGTLLDGLTARGLDDRTTLVFAGDNGHLHGEHRLVAKGLPYEESIQVPLLVRAPGVPPRDDTRLVAMNLDLPATVAELAGLPTTGEGIGLSAALADPSLPIRDHVFIETAFGAHPAWAGVVTDRWKYIEWGSGETELYDREADPYEMTSLDDTPPGEADIATLAAWVDEHRSLVVTTPSGLPHGSVGAEYDVALTTWGGTPPLTWSLELGTLPEGISLSPTGALTGVPTESGTFTVQVRVTDTGMSPFNGLPETYVQPLTLVIGAGAAIRGSWEAETAARAGAGAVFEVPARPGSHVAIRATLDDTRDTPAHVSATVVTPASGRTRLRLDGLDRTRTWFWDAEIDGVVVRGGVLPARVEHGGR